MRRHISALAICAFIAASVPNAQGLAALAPSLSIVNAYARAFGTRKASAVKIGLRLFTRRWGAQILRVYVDGAGVHEIAGIVLSGIKFHRPLTRAGFLNEVDAIIAQAFEAAPVEEVDLWCVVPRGVGKGAVVSGDLAQPTERTVFSITVRREDRRRRAAAMYWDARWTRSALHR